MIKSRYLAQPLLLLPQLSIGADVTEAKYGPALFGPSSVNIPSMPLPTQ